LQSKEFLQRWQIFIFGSIIF